VRTFIARGRGPGSCDGYRASVLDDPTLTAGRHRVELNFPSIRQSLIPFVRKSKREEEMNDLFHLQHPSIPATLDLTLIRKMKKRMLQIGNQLSLNFCTIAYGFAYFERLVFLGCVNRDNAKASSHLHCDRGQV